MKQKLLLLIFALATSAQGASLDAGAAFPPELAPLRQQSKAARLAAEVLTRYHYKSMPLDDAMSERIFDQYLKVLDGDKLFFVQADIDRLAEVRTRLDDAILEQNLDAPFAMFNLYAHRVAERFAYARSLLKQGFDFKQNESYQFAREKNAWANSEAEIHELWRKRVKNDWLRLKLAGNEDGSIVATLDKRYDNAMKRVGRVQSEDAFQTFMNAYTTAIDPHTNYLGPRAAEEFDIAMRLSVVGIGAVLAEKDDFLLIRELVPGGPAILSGQLKVGDRIVAVGQGERGVMTDILGWRVDDTVALIRGAPNTVVMLDILPAEAGLDGKYSRVSLIRKKISLEEQAAKKSVLSVMDGKVSRRVGVISLPSFYEDFQGRKKGDPDYRSASRDVARLLDQLKKEGVDSVLIDLRNNGGGSLSEAVDLTGLFIDKGPVVQQRFARGEVTVESDTRAGVAWDGPLGVMINRGSASASEIFAAAIQDYGRGLIIGEPSFGKGTVQSVVELDRVARSDKAQLGELKMTIAQFFRVNGGTTQLRGVKPDIPFPSIADAESFGESSFDNALPWMQVKAADYSPAHGFAEVLPVLLARHETRARKDKDFQYLQEDIDELKLQRKKNLVSLNEAERRKEQQAREARMASRDTRNNAVNGARANAAGTVLAPGKGGALRDDGLQADERNLANELAADKVQKDARDFLLMEAARILGDEVGMLKTSGAFAARARQGPL
jgi:carboxyl-terminal processing protease